MSYIDEILNEGNARALDMSGGIVHYLRNIATSCTKERELISINYKTDLNSYVRLDPEYKFSNDGLLVETMYYHDEHPVIKITEEYFYNEKDIAANLAPAKKTIEKRIKKWCYYYEDGTLDETGEEGSYKVKTKHTQHLSLIHI